MIEQSGYRIREMRLKLFGGASDEKLLTAEKLFNPGLTPNVYDPVTREPLGPALRIEGWSADWLPDGFGDAASKEELKKNSQYAAREVRAH